MITVPDSFYTYDLGKYYVIVPSMPSWQLKEFIDKFKAVKVPQGFSYNSLSNTEWNSVEELRELIKKHIDPQFVSN